MNRYFSRLAQRSGMQANASSARNGNASSPAADWSEQSFETVSTGDAATSGQGKHAIETANETSGTASRRIEKFAKNTLEQAGAPPVQSSIPLSNPNYPESNLHRIDKGVITGPAELSNTLETQSVFPQPFQPGETGKIDADTSEETRVPGQKVAVIENVSSSTRQQFSYSKKERVASQSNPSSAIKEIQPVTAFSSESADTMERSAPIKSLPPMSIGNNNSDEQSIVDARSTVRSEAVPSPHAAIANRKIDYVSSSAAQTNTLPVLQTRTMANSSIEVNIGKIELEIFTPARKSSPAPTPAPSSIPRAKPAAAFNPHRHYLRGS